MTRKGVYPIIITETKDGYFVRVPDFDSETQGESVAESMEMARDLIGLMGIDMEDEGKELPIPYSKEYDTVEGDIVTLVDIDFNEYRRKVDNRAVKKNCTIPYWLNVEAEKAGVNFSKLLQDAIMRALNIKPRGYN